MLRLSHRRVIHRVDNQADGGWLRFQFAITYLEGEVVTPIVVRVWCVGQVWRFPTQSAVHWLCQYDKAQLVAFYIAECQGKGFRGVFLGQHRLRRCHRCVIHLVDNQADGCWFRIQFAIAYLEGEAVTPIVVRVWCVGQVWRFPTQCAVHRLIYDYECDLISIWVRTCQCHSQGSIFTG